METTDSIKRTAYKNLPDKFYRQHHEFAYGGMEKSGLPKAKIRHPYYIDRLYEKGVIDASQHVAAVKLRRFWETIHSSIRSCLNLQVRGSASTEIYVVDTFQNGDFYRRIASMMDKKHFEFLVLICCEDYTMVQAARKLKHDRNKARVMLYTGLDDLSDVICEIASKSKLQK